MSFWLFYMTTCDFCNDIENLKNTDDPKSWADVSNVLFYLD